jgi:hypothetical protein
MRFEIFDIDPNKKYSFVIGTRAKPDTLIKERIRAQVTEAMSSLGRDPESYSVSIVQSEEPDLGEPELPVLSGRRDYLIFALLHTGEGQEPISGRELEETKEEISRGLFCPEGSRVTLVLLYDCTVRAIVTAEYRAHVVRYA